MLTVRSLRMLQLDASDLEAFVQVHKTTPLKRQVRISVNWTATVSLHDHDLLLLGARAHRRTFVSLCVTHFPAQSQLSADGRNPPCCVTWE